MCYRNRRVGYFRGDRGNLASGIGQQGLEGSHEDDAERPSQDNLKCNASTEDDNARIGEEERAFE